ncbi:MAG: DUF1641 domain-containing protein [Caldilinea sp. CFX5]|nr:DUF1641 domain-containing protein [Caldilinea sp. CFX5]
MERELTELTQKIDALTTQVAYLTDQAHLAERSRQERAELMHDLMPAVNGFYSIAVSELQEVEDYVRPEELMALLKRLLRNRRNIELLLDQLESVGDLVETVGPVSKAAFDSAVGTLEQMERKGYFAFSRGGLQILDNIVTSFNEEDVKALGDNIVLILQTIKSMTQPEILNFVRNTVMVVEGEKDKELDTSYMSLLRGVKDPNVRRGLALTMRVLGTIGAQTATPTTV